MAAGSSVSFEELDSSLVQQTDANAADKAAEKIASDAAEATRAAAATAQKANGKETKTTEFLDKEANEALDKLAEMGITPDSAEGIMQKAEAFGNVLNLLQNNPGSFLMELEKNDPKAFNGLLDRATDRYLELHPPSSAAGGGGSGGAGAGSAGASRGEQDPVTVELKALRERLDARDQRDSENDSRQRLSSIKTQYEEKVTGLLGKLTELTPRDRKAVRALVNESVSLDKQALVEINRGQFTSIAKHLQTVMTEWTADTKNASAFDHDKRTNIRDSASRASDAAAAAGQTGGESSRGKDDWDDVAESFGRALSAHK